MLLLLLHQLISHLQQPSSRSPACLHTLVLQYARENETRDLYDLSIVWTLWMPSLVCILEVHQYPIECVCWGEGGCYLVERLFAKYVSNMTNQDFIPIKVVRGILEPKSYHFPYREITQGKCLILRFLSLDKQI